MKTDEELKGIAQDLYSGKIFCDRQLSSIEELQMVFLPIAFMDTAGIDKMKADRIDFIYEYLSEAGPRSVNGKPTFMSCKTLNEDESKKMLEYYQKIRAAVADATK